MANFKTNFDVTFNFIGTDELKRIESGMKGLKETFSSLTKASDFNIPRSLLKLLEKSKDLRIFFEIDPINFEKGVKFIKELKEIERGESFREWIFGSWENELYSLLKKNIEDKINYSLSENSPISFDEKTFDVNKLKKDIFQYNYKSVRAINDILSKIQDDIFSIDFKNNLEDVRNDLFDLLDYQGRPADTDSINNIDIELRYLKDKIKNSDSLDDIYDIQKEVFELNKKRTSFTRGEDILKQIRDVDEINSLNGREFRIKVKDIGFEELTEKIRSLRKMLHDTENPLSNTQKKDVEGLISTYEKWHKETLRSMGTVKNAWGGVKGIGSGIEGITSALEGNKDAWSALTGMVDGFLQMYEGIMAVVEIIKKITEATKGATAAKAVENAVTEAGTAATTADTAATIGNTVATEAEATAEAKDAGAKVTKEGAKLPFPANIAAIAAGIAAVVAALAMVSGFATGGIVGGTSYEGDNVLARVNSGEMILNKRQQARLFGLLDGRLGGRFRTGVNVPAVALNVDGLRSAMGAHGQRVEFRLKGRNLVGVMANETRISSKSGRRTNIVI